MSSSILTLVGSGTWTSLKSCAGSSLVVDTEPYPFSLTKGVVSHRLSIGQFESVFCIRCCYK